MYLVHFTLTVTLCRLMDKKRLGYGSGPPRLKIMVATPTRRSLRPLRPNKIKRESPDNGIDAIN